MYSCCMTCKKWQGTPYSRYGLCYYIIDEILPKFYEYKTIYGWNAELPFDPHDVKYFEGMNERLLFIAQKEMPQDVVKDVRREDDIKFVLSQYDGSIIGERTAPIKLVYYLTNSMKKGCSHYENKRKA